METKIDNVWDLMDFYEEIADLLNYDYDKLESLISEKGLHDYSVKVAQVLSGNLSEDECTPEFCQTFYKCLQEIRNEL